MKKFEFVVQSPEGIHARPAMLLAQRAATLTSRVCINYNGMSVNAKNMALLLTLHVYQGAKVTFYLDGEEEEKDTKELKEFCKQNL